MELLQTAHLDLASTPASELAFSDLSFSAGPLQKNIQSSEDEFSRTEDKFILNPTQMGQVLGRLFDQMNPSYLDQNTQYTLIESLYFDGPQLDFFKGHLEGVCGRYKFRVRRYAPNGLWSKGPALLEIKYKKEGVTKKVRFKISNDELYNLKKGRPIDYSQALADLNPHIKEKSLRKRVLLANELITTYELRPMVAIQYKRYAFEKDNFRATLDDEIQYFIGPNFFTSNFQQIRGSELWKKADEVRNRFHQGSTFILEIKYAESIPSWVEQMLSELNIAKNSFSKYCWGISNLIERYTVEPTQIPTQLLLGKENA